MAKIELNGGFAALIDEADVDRVLGGRWYASRHRSGSVYCKGRVGKWGESRMVFLHRYLLDAPPDLFVDHINYNTLDCRRANLRLVTPAQNAQSARHHYGRSRFRGVRWHAQGMRWRAAIRRGTIHRSLGLFDREIDAAMAYDAAARELYGEFARLNFPSAPQGSPL